MQWIINAKEAKELIAEGATVLDVRPFPLWLLGHMPGAVAISWKDFSQSKAPNKGKLLENDEVLQQKLRQVGVSENVPVIVVGNPQDCFYFGEDGRIVWMLRSLGHSQVAFVNGGHSALVNAGMPIVLEWTQPQPGNFNLQRTHEWEIQRDELREKLDSEDVLILDTRETREYEGATPYGEKRGGHLPKAMHFYFKNLLDSQGYLLPNAEILAKLQALGIEKDRPIITYCTGGIRSAFFVAVLANIGLTNIKNYAGSTWEWSAASVKDYPLH